MTKMEFGYLAIDINVDIGDVRIKRLEGSDTLAVGAQDTYWLHDDWVYPPRLLCHNVGTDKVAELPYRRRVFQLPKTHEITSDIPNDETRLKFIVWVFGFVLGIRLTTEEAGFVDSSPVKTGTLVDFEVHRSQHNDIVKKIGALYSLYRSQPKLLAFYVGAINSHFISSNRNAFLHERFASLYAALDAVSELTRLVLNERRKTHTARIDWVCSIYSITTPAWASPDVSGNTEVATLRNENFHDALSDGEPLGYKLYNPEVVDQMRKLVSRLLIAILLGPQVEFVSSSLDSRLTNSLRF